MSELYTTTEVADILKVTRRSVYNYIKAGHITAVKIGSGWRISSAELDRFIKDAQSNTGTKIIY